MGGNGGLNEGWVERVGTEKREEGRELKRKRKRVCVCVCVRVCAWEKER